jgi:hypothetical protein
MSVFTEYFFNMTYMRVAKLGEKAIIFNLYWQYNLIIWLFCIVIFCDFGHFYSICLMCGSLYTRAFTVISCLPGVVMHLLTFFPFRMYGKRQDWLDFEWQPIASAFNTVKTKKFVVIVLGKMLHLRKKYLIFINHYWLSPTSYFTFHVL